MNIIISYKYISEIYNTIIIVLNYNNTILKLSVVFFICVITVN